MGKSFFAIRAEIHPDSACLSSGTEVSSVNISNPRFLCYCSSQAAKTACKPQALFPPHPMGNVCCCCGNDGLPTPLWPQLEICTPQGNGTPWRRQRKWPWPLWVFHTHSVVLTRKNSKIWAVGKPMSSLTGKGHWPRSTWVSTLKFEGQSLKNWLDKYILGCLEPTLGRTVMRWTSSFPALFQYSPRNSCLFFELQRAPDGVAVN